MPGLGDSRLVHLRACGVDGSSSIQEMWCGGASLHVRSGQLGQEVHGVQALFISACAEWTNHLQSTWDADAVHLCVCGVGSRKIGTMIRATGSSLRVRSGLLLTCGCVVALPL